MVNGPQDSSADSPGRIGFGNADIVMNSHLPKCMGQYNFKEVAAFARKRFIEGIDTISLLMQAQSEREKEQIILVSLLDVDADEVEDLQLSCRYADQCDIKACRKRLRGQLESDLKRSRERPADQSEA